MLKLKKSTITFPDAIVELIDIRDLQWTTELQALLLNSLSAEKQRRVLSYRNETDKIRSSLWEYCVKQHYQKEYGKTNIQIALGKYGKPYISGVEYAYFNVSHSGNYVAIAYSSYPVGIDIEHVHKWISLSLAKEICSEEELLELAQAAEFKESFIELWVLKESYLKCIGTGFLTDEPIPSFYVSAEVIKSSIQDTCFYLKRMNNYFMSLCVCNCKGEKYIV